MQDGLSTSWAEVVDSISSSYKQHNYGQLFYDIVRLNRPLWCAEIGVSLGYSTMHISGGLRANDRGLLQAYDLWYDNPMEIVQGRLRILDLWPAWCLLHHEQATRVPSLTKEPWDFVHIDIGNDGRTYLWAAEAFCKLLSPSGILALEGGTEERDNVEWMARDKCMPIRDALRQLEHEWHIFTFQAFPGLTIMRRRHDAPIG